MSSDAFEKKYVPGKMFGQPEIHRFVADVAVSGTTLSFDYIYSYLVPEEFVGLTHPGMRILVPFGSANRKKEALVLEVKERRPQDLKLKEFITLIDREPLIQPDMIRIIKWLKDTTFCTYFDAYKLTVPTGFSYRIKTQYSLCNTDFSPEEYTAEELEIIAKAKKATTRRELDEIFGEPNGCDLKQAQAHRKLIRSLVDKGAIEEEDYFKRAVGDEKKQMARLTDYYLSGEYQGKLSVRQRSVVNLLQEVGCASADEICYMTGATKAIIKRLAEKGVAQVYKTESFRKATADADVRRSPDSIKLNDEQTAAYDGIMALIKKGEPAGALLYGVTGSGKTSVFFKLIASTLAMGKTVLMLVPEISLTPQMVKQFKMYFGDEIALLHSSLSLGQRTDEFKRIRNGMAKIVIGTRSAVFAPLENIGLIIMDEEGERTYKSDSSPRYHARDVAIQRCGDNGCVLVMASATPSIESFYYAKKGRFHLFEMKKRYGDAVLPEVEIIDMQSEAAAGNTGLFSRKLAQAVSQTLEKGEQSILLLNRRGYTTFVSCTECRQPISCPNCNMPLTYHKKNNRLMCHYCGYAIDYPRCCPECGCTALRQSGAGTQRVEDEVQKLFPDARILRMDADTTFSRTAYEEKFAAFERGEYDIMLGTQMIAKGLNFPNVTLVGIVSVDKALFTGDYRSYERTFSLITQVAGRSGRGDKPGKAFIQTFVPDHYVINLAAQQDYDEFYEQEAAMRHTLLYPPYCDTCTVSFSATLESKAIEASELFMRILRDRVKRVKDRSKLPLRVLGPAACTIGRINNRYRYRIIIKCRVSSVFRELMSGCLTEFMKNRQFGDVRISADVNGDIGL